MMIDESVIPLMKSTPLFFVEKPSMMLPLDYVVRFALRYPDGSYAIAQPVVMKKFGRDEPGPDEPMLLIDYVMAEPVFQSLLDSLWNLGFRPTDIGTAGHLAATKEHLSDMRKLVAKTYGVEL